MAKCAFCGKVILFGAIHEDGVQFCSKPCQAGTSQFEKADNQKVYIFIANWVISGIAFGYITNYAKEFESLWLGLFFITNGCTGLYVGVLPFLPAPADFKINHNKIISSLSIIAGTVISCYFFLNTFHVNRPNP